MKRGESSVNDLSKSREARELARSIQTAVQRRPTSDPWRPGMNAADSNPELDTALLAIGWQELGEDDAWLPYIAPAARELGRGFAPLDTIDQFLGGALRVGEYARYCGVGDVLVSHVENGLRTEWAVRLLPVGYTDAIGVSKVIEVRNPAVEADASTRQRRDAWLAGTLGYMAGLTEEALRLATEHVMTREAFGRPLAALEPVQQQLATAATLSAGITLLTTQRVEPFALSHAGEAACQVTAICQQVVGAIGYALEFPLQRAYRRSRVLQQWTDEALSVDLINAV